MDHILLAITGTSPQIITETLYALNSENHPWPSQIFIITTSVGAAKVKNSLIIQNKLKMLCNELRRELPNLTIWIIPNAEGIEVDDARSKADHEALADFIMLKTVELTKNNNIQVHASIAGGRKTMTYYMGYAMSLFGRPQDRLSHVLVSDDFESHPDFYYPSINQSELTNRFGKTMQSRNIQITLADIPFIRLKNNLPPLLGNIGRRLPFRKVVELINFSSDFEGLAIEFNVKKKTLSIFNQANTEHQDENMLEPLIDIEFSSTILYAFYLYMVDAYLNDVFDLYSPFGTDTDIDISKGVVNWFYQITKQKAPTTFADKIINMEEYLTDSDEKGQIKRTMDRLAKGVTSSWFSTQINLISNVLKDALPLEIINQITPAPLFKNGIKSHKKTKSNNSKNSPTGYGLQLDKHRIKVLNH